MSLRTRTTLLLCWVWLQGCRPEAEPRASSIAELPFVPAPPPSALTDTSAWAPSSLGQFTIRHPRDAAVLSDTDRFSGAVGTALVWRFADMQWLRLTASHFRPSLGGELADFVDSARAVRNASLDPDWQLGAASPLRVGRYEALELRPSCGDCVAYEIYVALPSWWVVFSFSLEQGLPYTYEQQEQFYRLMVATVRHVDPS